MKRNRTQYTLVGKDEVLRLLYTKDAALLARLLHVNRATLSKWRLGKTSPSRRLQLALFEVIHGKKHPQHDAVIAEMDRQLGYEQKSQAKKKAAAKAKSSSPTQLDRIEAKLDQLLKVWS